MTEWKEISELNPDELEDGILITNGHRVGVGYWVWEEDKWYFREDQDSYNLYHLENVTHYMPFPDPPVAEKTQPKSNHPNNN